MGDFTHFNERGEASMVDVGEKSVSMRKAVAEGHIRMSADTLAAVVAGTNRKGDVLAVARIAGIMGAKRAAELVPLCHPLSLTHVSVDFECDQRENRVRCTASAETHDRTGVEMEALAAVQVALLTVYDMCKSTDRGMEIESVRLVSKSGGRSGEWNREN